MIEAAIGFVCLVLLIFLRMPIALAMCTVGFFGFSVMLGLEPGNIFEFNWQAPISATTRRLGDTAQEYGLSVIPLFLLMGSVVSRTELSHDLYRACDAFLGHLRGGLAMATVVACGFFSAICGSSLATTATMSKVAMPQMLKRGYDEKLSTASIAAGGTLGILIPPSVILVIYGLITQTSIRELFAAGFVPGVLGICLYLLAVKYVTWRRPSAGPSGDPIPFGERFRRARGVWGTLSIFVVGIGGIYAGVFTPTEAASVSAAMAMVIAAARGKLSLKVLRDSLFEAGRTSAMIFSVLIGALVFSTFINRTTLTSDIINLISASQIPPLAVMFVILLFYIGLGMVFESLSMLLLTIPVFFPLVVSLGFDPVWFGIIAVVVTEISLITPPVGLNVFVLSSVLPGTSTSTIFRGVTPFWCVDIVRLAILVLVPALSLTLPQLLYH